MGYGLYRKGNDTSTNDTFLQGYKETLYGRFCYLLCLLMSLQWVALLVVLLYDYYAGCQVGGIDNWCFYGNVLNFEACNVTILIFFCWSRVH